MPKTLRRSPHVVFVSLAGVLPGALRFVALFGGCVQIDSVGPLPAHELLLLVYIDRSSPLVAFWRPALLQGRVPTGSFSSMPDFGFPIL